jgi:SAM-dependent methyltransferase
MTPDPAAAAASDELEQRWRQLAGASPQLRTQATDPDGWRRFYDRVAPLWDDLTAGVEGLGSRIAELARQQRLLRPGDEVLEVGCGAGRLALAMAERGAVVTAVDQSPGMIGVLRARLRDIPRPGVAAAVADWHRLRCDRGFDLAAACCFPDAVSPDGLRELDRLSRRHCLVVLGRGGDAFPLRRWIWRRAMDEPLPPEGRFLPLVLDALETLGRQPCRAEMSWPARLDVDADDARTFFEAYFSTLGCSGRRLRDTIEDVIEQHLRDGRVRCTGRIDLTAVWWRAGDPTAEHGAAAP